jgi:hypothetical protein
MKPTRSRIFCRDSGKSKILFETEKKADNFIRFNAEEIASASGFSPVRSYFCISCGGYHVTSKETAQEVSRSEKVLEEYNRYKQETKTGKQKMKQIKENRKKENHDSN